MKDRNNNSLKEKKTENKKENKYIDLKSIIVIGISLLFTFIVLATIQGIMGKKVVTITDNAAEQYYYDGRFDDAIKEYTSMQDKDVWPISTVEIANICSLEGDITYSDSLLREAMVKRDKVMNEDKDKYIEQDKELINKVVFIFYINNELDQAESLGEYYLGEYDTYKPLLKTMFAVYLAKGETEKAEELVKAYPVDNESAYDLAILAKMQIILGNYNDGLENLKKSYDLDKNEVKSFDVIRETCEFNKSKLLEKVEELSEENPNEKVYKVWLEEINLIDGSNNNPEKDIINEINRNITLKEVDKDSYVYKYVKAWDYYNKGDYEKALECCNEAIKANPENSESFGILMPEILISMKEPTKVDGYIRTAVYNEPFNYNLISSIGKIYQNKIGDNEKAIGCFNLALLLNKDEDKLYYNLALANINIENFDDAIEDLKKAISINNNYKYYRALGTTYFNKGDYEDAIENIRKAYSLNDKDVLSLNNAACYYAMVEHDIWRAYSNIESAYKDMPSDLDESLKEVITTNYNLIKNLYDKYVNDESTPIIVDGLKLIY